MAYGYNQDERPFGVASTVSERAAFITRTYMHLLGAIVLFTLLEIAFFNVVIGPNGTVAQMVANAVFSSASRFTWLLILGGFMVISYIATMLASASASKPKQYLGLALYVVGESLIFIPLLFIANARFPGLISSAALITLLGFAALTAVVFITRKDFSFMRGILFWAGAVALLAIVGSAIFGFQLGFFFNVAMIAFAGAAILYETSNVLHKYPTTHYVAASVALFASVALLFWYVLRIMMSSRN